MTVTFRSFPRETAKYWPFYCEENIWHLCHDARISGQTETVIFITNSLECCYFEYQKTGNTLWDYHVIMEVDRYIWDLDSILDFPVPTSQYLDKTFDRELDTYFQPVFLQYDKRFFLERFYSDRHHMKTPTGDFLKPPPPWEVITPKNGIALDDFLSLENHLPVEKLTLFEKIQRTSPDK